MRPEIIFLIAPPILFALTIHEYAHAWVADFMGDPTARYAGRLSLNPLRHLDPIGTLMIFLVYIGWAKPVPINQFNLRDPKRDMIWISLAGPGANILGGLGCGLLLRLMIHLGFGYHGVLFQMILFGLFINLALAFFNLIPIPPLDGSKILMGLLPREEEWRYGAFERYGFIILIGLVLLGRVFNFPVLWFILRPFVKYLGWLFSGLDPTAFIG